MAHAPTGNRPLKLALIAVLGCGLLGVGLPGCGQKGNLYLPSQQQKKKVPSAPAQPADAPPPNQAPPG